jgi:hypothetical protein
MHHTFDMNRIPEYLDPNRVFHQHESCAIMDPADESRSIISVTTSNISLNHLRTGSQKDEMSMMLSPSSELRKKGPRGGITDPFPVKLHSLLDSSSDEFDHIISWQPHGRCFLLHKPQEFLKRVMNHYFKQTKLTSFQRQLNLYGFHRLIAPGPDRGGYYHELFVRGMPELATKMIRCRIKGARRGHCEPEKEPEFYKMPCMENMKSKMTMSSTSSLSSTSVSSNSCMYMPTSFPAAVVKKTDDVPIKTGTVVTFEGMEFHYLDAPALAFLEEESVSGDGNDDDHECMWPSNYIL